MIPGVDLLEVVDRDMGINLSRFQGFVAEHLLQVSGGSTVSEHVGSARVAEGVRGDILFDARQLNTALDRRPYSVGIHLLSPAV